jgi:glycosyltransferase involved in cell wall biosynthesis
VKRVDAVFAYGSLAAQYASELGAPVGRIVIGTNAIDCPRFFGQPGRREAKRRELGADGKVLVLYSGQLIQRKGLDVVIQALSEVQEQAELLVIGDGPDRKLLEEAAARIVPGRVHFLGHRPYDELPGLYAASDILVMPSEIEVWGLVLNEAMAAGLPVISSTTAGATADLVVGRRTGFAVPPRDVKSWAVALRALASEPTLRAEMGANASRLIRELDTEKYATDLLACARLALS